MSVPLQNMDTTRRSDKQPLLNRQRISNHLKVETQTVSDANGSCKWKFWITFISITIALIFVVYTLVDNNEIPWLSHSANGNHGNPSLKITSYLSDERIARVESDTGLTEAAKSDLITYLPGLQVDINDLNFHMYSGYLEVDNTENDGVDDDITKEIFYWFFEADCDDPDNQPVMIWTNGGPGCSGMDGLLTEHGALLVNDDLELYVNDYAWNKHVNIMYIEQPYGVGMSLPTKGQVVAGDNNAAEDIDSLIRHFIETYPKYSDSDIYISSESWGGHYMPMTAFHILSNNAAGHEPYINFKGVLLGNPYTEYYENWIGFMEALYGHGLMKQTTYETWRSNCYGQLPDLTDAVCTLNYIQAFIGAIGVDWYALDFPDCDILEKYAMSFSEGKFQKMAHIHAKRVIELYDQMKEDETFNSLISEKEKSKIESHLSRVRGASGSISYYACVDDYMASYLNQDSVQSALHAKSTNWAMCSDDVYYDWENSDWINGMQTVYHTILNDYGDSGIKILLYSGDDDSVCGTAGTQYWLRNMGWEVDVSYDWKEWRYEGELAGYYTKFLHSDGTTALYLQTVRSAGHMVPTTQPKRSLELLNRFLNYYEY